MQKGARFTAVWVCPAGSCLHKLNDNVQVFIGGCCLHQVIARLVVKPLGVVCTGICSMVTNTKQYIVTPLAYSSKSMHCGCQYSCPTKGRMKAAKQPDHADAAIAARSRQHSMTVVLPDVRHRGISAATSSSYNRSPTPHRRYLCAS